MVSSIFASKNLWKVATSSSGGPWSIILRTLVEGSTDFKVASHLGRDNMTYTISHLTVKLHLCGKNQYATCSKKAKAKQNKNKQKLQFLQFIKRRNSMLCDIDRMLHEFLLNAPSNLFCNQTVFVPTGTRPGKTYHTFTNTDNNILAVCSIQTYGSTQRTSHSLDSPSQQQNARTIAMRNNGSISALD